MRALSVRTLCGVAATLLFVAAAAGRAEAQPRPGDAELLQALRAGGHVIVLRNPPADPDKADIDPLNFKNIKGQQPLTDQGRALARVFGERLRELGVPIGEVLTSRFQRCYQTALLAGFKTVKPVTELTDGAIVVSPNENRRRAAAMKQLIASPLQSGQNRLLITHKNNILQAFGKEWFEVKEGEASIFRVEKGSYSLVGRLQLEEWARLGQTIKP